MSVTYWVFDYGGSDQYIFERNPDRYGGDTGWIAEARIYDVEIIGSNLPNIQVDGFRGARRTIRFPAIKGEMKRILEQFYYNGSVIENCRDHLYPTNPQFNCIIESFTTAMHPTTGNFPGSLEDTWDLEMGLVRTG